MGKNQPIIKFSDCINIDRLNLGSWLIRIADLEGAVISNLIYNCVSREKIVEVNKRYLHHDYPTDIITFDYCSNNKIAGDIFICPDVIAENAKDLFIDYNEELNRVIVHGLLHLMGYEDKTAEGKKIMRNKEDQALSVLYADGE